jgi:hypothetical protein
MNNETIPTFQIIIEREIAKFDLTAAAVKKLELEFMPLMVRSLEDEDGYAEVKEALRFMVGKRNEIEDKRKELKADSLKFGRAVDEEAKRLTLMLSPIEAHLKEQKDKVDIEKKRVALEQEALRQRVIMHRHQMLIDAGMVLLGDTYVFNNPIDLEQTTLHSLNVETMEDNDFNEFAYNISMLKKQVDILVKEEQEKNEKAQLALKQEQDKIKAERESMQLEMAVMLKERTSIRVQGLTALGIQYSQFSGFFFYSGVSIVTIGEVESLNSSDWEIKFGVIRNKVSNISREIEAKIAEEEIHRQEEIVKIQAEAEAKAIRDIEIKAEYDAKVKAESDRIEAERVEGLSDKQKICIYCDYLLSTPRPEMKTVKYKKEMKVLLDAIAIHINP